MVYRNLPSQRSARKDADGRTHAEDHAEAATIRSLRAVLKSTKKQLRKARHDLTEAQGQIQALERRLQARELRNRMRSTGRLLAEQPPGPVGLSPGPPAVHAPNPADPLARYRPDKCN